MKFESFQRARVCIAHGFNVKFRELLSSLSSLELELLSMASLGLTELLFGYVTLLLLSLSSLEEL